MQLKAARIFKVPCGRLAHRVNEFLPPVHTTCDKLEIRRTIRPVAGFATYIRGRMFLDIEIIKFIAYGVAVSLVIEAIAYVAIFGW